MKRSIMKTPIRELPLRKVTLKKSIYEKSHYEQSECGYFLFFISVQYTGSSINFLLSHRIVPRRPHRFHLGCKWVLSPAIFNTNYDNVLLK